MSAFIVEDTTINRVVNYLADDHNRGYTMRQLNEAGLLTDPANLGQAMAALNCEAVNERYDEHEAPSYTYGEGPLMRDGVHQVLKSLKCWIYQCSEGDVPETALYKIMDDYAGQLAITIVRSAPEYEAAEWG